MKRFCYLLFLGALPSLVNAQCWQTLSAGMDHTVAVQSDGTLWAWGFNESGQLGDGTTAEKQIPTQIGTDSDWKTVSASGNHTLAIKTDGSLWTWGDNLWGQLGNGAVGTQKNAPAKIGTATDWKAVYAGSTFSFGIKTDGTLWAWGDNFSGQLGISSYPFTPTKVGTDTNWKSISAGGSHTLAIKTDGSLWAWGLNSDDQLGDGTAIDKNIPTKIGTALNWASISAGYDFSMALKTDGTLWVWGNNDMGQLGDGTYAGKNIPMQLGIASDWQAITTGSDNSLAIKTDGTLWAWGWIIGKFGFGTDNTKNIPTQTGTASDWMTVSSGESHSFAFKTDGTLWAWGDNTWGKLGNDSWLDQSEPGLISSAAPTGDAVQTFCNAATISNLTATGSTIKWYGMATGGVALSNTTALVNGSHYHASQTKYNCESESRLDITVSLNTTPTTAPSGSSSQSFCGSASIVDLTVTGADIKWYTASSGGIPLTTTTVLENGSHYFASQTLNACESSARLDVMVTITQAPAGQVTQTLCTGATVSNLVATGADIKWYNASTGGSVLPGTTVLVNGNHYYATQTINSLESCDRLKVTVSITATPSQPTGQATQAFCTTDIVADLTATGTNIRWYDTPSGGSALSSSLTLLDGTHYYASQTVNICESATRLEVAVLVNTTPTSLPLGASFQTVCEGSPINALAVQGTAVKWYASASGGSDLPPTHLLADGTHYFASQSIRACESSDRLDVLVTLAENTTSAPINANPVKWAILSTNTNSSTSIKADGTLWAWGINNDYELADGTTVSKSFPIPIGKDTDWKSISRGQVHAQAIKTDGTLWGWGYNYHGNLGDGTAIQRKVVTRIGTSTDWLSVAVGHYHSIAIKTDGTLWAWGDNYDGVLGNSTTAGFKRTPTQIGIATNWKSAFARDNYNLAIKADGTLWAWGDNYNEQLGDGTNVDKYIPVQIGTSGDWETVSAGGEHVLALKNDGTLWAWGRNSYGQLGDGTKTNKSAPTQIGSANDWKTISAGDTHSMAIKTDGTLWIWGDNYGAQLGDGTDPNSPPLQNYRINPRQINSDTDWETISAGYYHSLAIKSDGTLWGWGYNGYGEVGDGTNTIRNVPKLILSSSQTLCEGAAIADLSATGNDIKWYASDVASEVLASDITLTNGATYYATQTVSTCESATRLSVTVSIGITTVPAPTGSAAITDCPGATIADLATGGSHIKWYAAASGGTALASNTTLQNETHYYASQTVSACESESRLEVTVTLNTNQSPAPAGLSEQTFCAGATIEDLVAEGAEIKWYDGPAGGSPLSFSTLLTDDAHYYASQTSAVCESSMRLDVVASVNNTQSPSGNSTQTFCFEATIADLTANGTEIKWYNTFAGDSPLPASTLLTDNTHYFASQTFNGCESLTRLDVTASVNATGLPTGISSQVFCDGSMVENLTANGAEIKWYNTPAGGFPLPPSSLLADNSYYYASQTLNGCESAARLEVTAIVNTTPPPGGNSIQSFCHEATVADLDATGNQISWYVSVSEGSPLAASTHLVNGAYYYVSQNLNECESSARLKVAVSISLTPAPLGDANQPFCLGATLTDLLVTGNDIKWYATETDETVLPGTFLLENNKAYFATQTNSSCESQNRLSVSTTVNEIPPAPPGDPVQSFENGNTLSGLIVVGSGIKWYGSPEDAGNGINALGETTLLQHEARYYATQTVNGCESHSSTEVTAQLFLTTHTEWNEEKLDFFPNPVVDFLTLSLNESMDNFRVVNQMGQIMIADKVNSRNIIVDLRSVKAGIYFIHLSAGQKQIVLKVAKK